MNGPDAPHPWGLSPKDIRGNVIVLHHYKQQSMGPIIGMPEHQHSVHDKGQHPNGNSKGGGITNRKEFNNWKREFWHDRAQKTLSKKSGGCLK